MVRITLVKDSIIGRLPYKCCLTSFSPSYQNQLHGSYKPLEKDIVRSLCIDFYNQFDYCKQGTVALNREGRRIAAVNVTSCGQSAKTIVFFQNAFGNFGDSGKPAPLLCMRVTYSIVLGRGPFQAFTEHD